MRTTVFFSLLTMVFFTFIACKNSNAPGNNQEYSEDNHPVRTLYLSSIEALNEGNLDLFLANFAPEIKMYGTDGNYFGENSVRKRFEGVLLEFPSIYLPSSYKLLILIH